MSRSLSSETLQAFYAGETDEVFLILLTISHDSLTDPIRVTSDSVQTVNLGQTFEVFPFDIRLPDDVDGRAPRARITIENVSRDILRSIKTLNSPPKIKMEVIRAADPDTVEASFPDFTLRNITYNALTIQGDLSVEDFTAEPYPAILFTPSGFPALF